MRAPSPRGAPRRWRAPALRGTTAHAAFKAVTAEALVQIDVNARGVLASSDPEYLHQLRVGMRRLRSALRAWRAVLPSKPRKRVVRELRHFSSPLGRARDWDVLVARLQKHAAPAEMLAKACGEREQANRAARRAVASRRFADLQQHARALTADTVTDTLAQFGADALQRARRKLKAGWRDAEARHAMRIRVKRLRYACEFFAQAFPARAAAAYISVLKDLQEILGELNDLAVGRRLIGLDADERALLRKLESAWSRFERRPVFWRG